MLNRLFILFLFVFPFFVYSLPSNSIYNIEASIVDRNGNYSKFSDLNGKVHVFSMVYTNCKTICPVIIANMKAIEKLLFDNNVKNVAFSLMTLDPNRDSVIVLDKFFTDKKMNKSSWNLYKAAPAETLKIATATGIKYKKEKNNEYVHSNLIIILDKDGIIRMHHQALDKNFDQLLKLVIELSA